MYWYFYRRLCACVFYDSKQQAIGVAHAGWRGTISHIVINTLDQLKQSYNCSPNDLFVVIAPCISSPNYEVGQDMYDTFQHEGFPVNDLFLKNLTTQKWHLDLRKANHWLLMESGIPSSQIEIINHCTFEQSDTYFSARKSGIKSGRMASFMMLK